MSLRGRLIAIVTTVTTITLGGAFLVVFFLGNRAQLIRLDEALHAVAVEQAEEIAATGDASHVLPVRPGPRANDVGPLPRHVALYDQTGAVLATTPSLSRSAPALDSLPPARRECFNLWVGHDHLRGVLVDVPHRPGMHLLVATSRADVDGDERFLARSMLIVFVFAVGWAALVATWLVGRLTRHHDRIAAVARSVAAGDLSARIGARRTVADMDQLGRDIDDMIERLGMLVTSQQRFVAHAAHELRSPLTTLYGELSHALRKQRDAESYRKTIEEALDSTRKLKVLTEDLLALARIGSSGEEPRHSVGVQELARAATASVASEAAERGVTVRVSGTDATVTGRPMDLERMVRNLVENGVRHAPPSTEVEVTTSEQAGHAVVRVADQGSGVDPSDRDRVFEPFYRGAAERAKDLPGAGLGLAIAREIARLHGGDVHLLDSERGAVFEAVLRYDGRR
jgi:two-component system heavy metal sensor histidine kinase CusS